MSRGLSHKDRTHRAFAAYLNVLDAAEWLRREVRAPLESRDLTMVGFRLLELLCRVEIMTIADAARLRGTTRQTMNAIIGRLEENGWVQRVRIALPPADPKGSHLPKSKRGEPRRGVRANVVKLTPEGRRFMKDFLGDHLKLVKALMRVLGTREQDALSRICLKLQKNDAVKFLQELRTEDLDEDEPT